MNLHYLEKGTPDEQLRTYYYQAQIYSNRGEHDNAMNSLLNGEEIEGITDSLTYAHLLVCKGVLYCLQYKDDKFIESNLAAAKIYGSMGLYRPELKAYCKALNGATMLEDKILADSLVAICSSILDLHHELRSFVAAPILMYTVKFGSKDQFYDQVNEIDPTSLTDEIALILSQGFSKYGDKETALILFDKISTAYQQQFPKKYFLTKTEILENSSDYEETLTAYKGLVGALGEFYSDMISRDLLFAEKKHDLELAKLMAEKSKQRHIFIFSLGGLSMLLILLFIFYHYSLAKANSIRKQAEVDLLKAEQMSLQKERESLELKNKASELELKQQKLEAENLRLEILQAEQEHTRLKQLLEEKKELDPEIFELVKQRLEFLNGLIASDLASNVKLAEAYNHWIEYIRTNQKEFMESTRKILSLSHPDFIRHLEEKNLSDDEINYVCLYAIGLRGKEIGDYIKLRRHYVISCDVRKKLGLDEHSRNLGPYIRELMAAKPNTASQNTAPEVTP